MRQLHKSVPCYGSGRKGFSAENVFGEPLLRGLEGFWNSRVRRFRIAYTVDRRAKAPRISAVGHREHLYEEMTEQVRRKKEAVRPLTPVGRTFVLQHGVTDETDRQEGELFLPRVDRRL